MNTTWTKLRNGEWGLRSEEALTVGTQVWVTRKNGTRSLEWVGPKVWAGQGVWLHAKGEPVLHAEEEEASEDSSSSDMVGW